MQIARADKIVALVFIAAAFAGAAMTLGFPSMRGLAFGPEFFPRVVFGLMLAGGLVLLLRKGPPRHSDIEILGGEGPPRTADDEAGRLSPLFDDRRHVIFAATLVAGLVAYVALLDRIGFIPLTAAFGFVVVKLSGGRWIGSAVFAAAFTLLVHWGFVSLLRVPLPAGLLGP